MKRVNLYDFFELGGAVAVLADRIGTTPDPKYYDNIGRLDRARRLIGEFLLASDALNVRVSRQAAAALHAAIADNTRESYESGDRSILNAGEIALKTDELGVLLAAELPTLDTYLIDQQGAFSTPTLLVEGERIVGREVGRQLPPTAVLDLREAGRALVLNLFTAAGFHVLRATEAVIRSYYARVVGHAPKPKHRNWGTYVKALTAAGADAKIVSAIDQIRELQRNPLMHPEVVLTESDALTVFGMSQGVIAAMVSALAKPSGIAP